MCKYNEKKWNVKGNPLFYFLLSPIWRGPTKTCVNSDSACKVSENERNGN